MQCTHYDDTSQRIEHYEVRMLGICPDFQAELRALRHDLPVIAVWIVCNGLDRVLGIESLGHRSDTVRLSREKMWMKSLRTIQPHGLNIQEGND